MGDFKLLEAVIKDWPDCSKAEKRALLPEASVEHAQKVLEPDNKLRSWKGHPGNDDSLLYACTQAQINLDNPAGEWLVVCILLRLPPPFAPPSCPILSPLCPCSAPSFALLAPLPLARHGSVLLAA